MTHIWGSRYGMSLTQEQKDIAAQKRAAIMEAARASGYISHSRKGELPYSSYIWGSRLLVYNALVEAYDAKGCQEKVYLQEVMAKGSNQAPETRGGYTVFDFSDRTLKALQWLAKQDLVMLSREDFGARKWQAIPLTDRIDSIEELEEIAKTH